MDPAGQGWRREEQSSAAPDLGRTTRGVGLLGAAITETQREEGGGKGWKLGAKMDRRGLGRALQAWDPSGG